MIPAVAASSLRACCRIAQRSPHSRCGVCCRPYIEANECKGTRENDDDDDADDAYSGDGVDDVENYVGDVVHDGDNVGYDDVDCDGDDVLGDDVDLDHGHGEDDA